MTAPVAEKLPRKKRSILWWLAGLLLAIVGAFLYQLFGPNPPIIVSRETTFLTEPLRPDGLPDYERYVLERSREGVTPQNNAAVLVWQAIWPGELDVRHYGPMAAELGLAEIPFEDEALLSLTSDAIVERVLAWLRRNDPVRQEASTDDAEDDSDSDQSDFATGGIPSDKAYNLIIETMSRPWTTSEVPPLGDWVLENRRPLDLIVAASRRSRYYSPSPSMLEAEGGPMISWLIPGLQGTREATRSLATRAMWHLGEGRLEKSWQDLLAIHRLARLVGQGQMLVEQLVGVAIEGMATHGTIILLSDAALTPELARQISRDIAGLGELASVAAAHNNAERLMYLQTLIELGSGRHRETFEELFGPLAIELSRLKSMSIDWNVPLRMFNEYFDRVEAALALPTRAERDQAMDQIEIDYQQAASNASRPAALFRATLSRAERSRSVAQFIFPRNPRYVLATDDRANVTLRLLRLAAALAVYRAEQDAYPETLAALAPGVIKAVPADVYGQPLVYRRVEEGYLLYSIGRNGVDDGGSNEEMQILEGQSLTQEPDGDKRTSQIPTGADDVSIRLPPPELRIPTVPAQPADNSQ